MPQVPTVVVLAGGASTRMGTHKPDVVVVERTMLEWVVRAAGDLPTLVVGGPEVTATRWIPDEVRNGPAGALALALTAVNGPVIIVGADQPWLRPETLAALAVFPSDAACVPVEGEQRQVMCARYPGTIADIAARVANDGGGLQRVLDLIPRAEVDEERWRAWDEDGRSWFGVDTPKDLETGLARYGPPA